MKKIMLISWDMSVLGGINQVLVTLADNLYTQYDITVVSLVKSKEETAYKFLSPDINVVYIMNEDCRGRQVILKGYSKLRRLIKERKIDVAFLMGFQVSLPVIMMTFGKKCKYVFCDHEALLSRWHEKKVTAVRYLTAVFSDKVVTLTKQNAEDYISKFKLSEKKVTYIYNSIDEKIISHAGEYDKASKIILSVGRFSPEKRYDLLAEVADAVLKRNPEWKWYIYGDGETFPEIESKIHSLKLQDSLILKGAVSDVSEIYAEASLFVLTSQREGLPLVLLEAKANHLPCISFDIVSGPKEIIRDNVDGFLIDPYDKNKMIQAIETLIRDESLRIKMSENTGGNLEKFSNQKVMEKWRTLIDTI